MSAFHPFRVDKCVLYCDDTDKSDVRVEASRSVSNAVTSSSNQQPGMMLLLMSAFHPFGVDNEYYTVMTLTSQTSELRLHVQLAGQSPAAATNNQV